MENQLNKRTASRTHRYILVASICILSVFMVLWFAGCATTNDGSSDNQNSSGTEEPVAPVELTGTILEINDGELLIEVTTDNSEDLQGEVRVDLSQIDAGKIEGLQVGDVIEIVFSGAVGMSEPPYVSADTLEIVE